MAPLGLTFLGTVDPNNRNSLACTTARPCLPNANQDTLRNDPATDLLLTDRLGECSQTPPIGQAVQQPIKPNTSSAVPEQAHEHRVSGLHNCSHRGERYGLTLKHRDRLLELWPPRPIAIAAAGLAPIPLLLLQARGSTIQHP